MGFWYYSSYICYTYCSNTILLYTILSEGCSEMKDNKQLLHEYKAKIHEKALGARSDRKKAKDGTKFLDLAAETDEFVKNQDKTRKNANLRKNFDKIGKIEEYIPDLNKPFGPKWKRPPEPKSEPATPDPNFAFRRKKHGERSSTEDSYNYEKWPVPTKEILDDLLDKVHKRQEEAKKLGVILPGDADPLSEEGNTPWPEDETEWDDEMNWLDDEQD